MSKIRSISSFAAFCCLATAAFAQTDGVGVTVTLNGAGILHRTGIGYPSAARQRGVQGTVSVEVKLDSTGEVNDARVLSGPEELRNSTLQSVLQWHFSRDVAGTSRVIQVAFEIPPASTAAMPPPPPPASMGALRPVIMQGPQGTQALGRIRSVRVSGLSESVTADLLSRMPFHEGDELNAETLQKANDAVRAYDEHLSLQISRADRNPSGSMDMALVIAVSNGPDRIKVGGNVQTAMILKKTPPIYPAAAKANHVSGIVHLAVVIGKDGTIEQVQLIDGPAELTQAAIDAVKQWVYKPTMLNGAPVQVDTTVDINFTLSQ